MAKKELSRREFMKSAAAGALGMAAVGVLPGLKTKARAAGTNYIPGTYSATAKGMGDVTVTMTFDETSITEVVLDVSNETPGIGQAAVEDLKKQLLENQVAEIDGVSGATITTKAVRQAAASCIAQAKGLETADEAAAATVEKSSAPYIVPKGLTAEEVEGSAVELGELEVSETKEYDIVVVGAGAAGVVAAGVAAEDGAKVALLQKESGVVSQGNCGSAIILSKSTEAGVKKWAHMTNALNDWRSNVNLLNAYAKYSEPAMMWYLNRAGLTDATEYSEEIDGTDVLTNEDAGIFCYMNTSQELTGVWQDRCDTYDFGEDKCYFFAPWIGPKPKNVGNVLQVALDNVMAKNSNLETFYNTPAVQIVKDGDRVTGVIAKDESGKYVQFNGKKGVILATGDYQNNDAMVERWCPDTADFDKKQYGKTGDGHILAISAGAKMENLGHTKMMHDFDSGLMYEEPYLYVNMEGERFTNEYTGFVYMGDVLKHQGRHMGANVDKNHPDGSKGWYCQIYDSDYVNIPDEDFVDAKIPPEGMLKYIPGEVEDPQGVFEYLIDTHKADTIEELAEMLELDPVVLQATIDRYNDLCESGDDVDFGKPAKYMHPIKTAPFWGIRKHIRVSAICSGVNINENGQALDEKGEVIPGLYCIGNLGGPFYGGNDYPFHQTGLSLGRCYTFGYIAAKHIMES